MSDTIQKHVSQLIGVVVFLFCIFSSTVAFNVLATVVVLLLRLFFMLTIAP